MQQSAKESDAKAKHVLRIEIADDKQVTDAAGNATERKTLRCDIVNPMSTSHLEVSSNDSNLRTEVQDIVKNLQASILPIFY